MNEPLYRKVIDKIVAQISTGELLPGSMLPSEMQIAAETGVSQGTARKSLMMLEQLGIVRREQGRGTFVTARTPESSLFNFFRLRQPDGQMIRPELVSQEVTERPALPLERETLDGAPMRVFEIRRVRSLRGTPSIFETTVVSTIRFSGLDQRAPLPNTLYVLYQQSYGCIILRADESISSVLANDDTSQALGVPPGMPLLCVDRVAFDIMGRQVERRRSLCRTDTMVYQVSLT
ncbi:GntR family transcriptional regulator [Paracoccus laeviglucosivorans]|uniref:GntR family transcriptional regulator n=1 Tax=Paracoccus laeviglucosivorans TaxID=1197861 RepID=A0A521FMU3_9RHOB|nr:GntR family transcriptional regulator [Paracoccus laeviglucosivorans]SMO97444.1 GntR family transcriptional regulator [Paracoccus laeviglucosivorans]